MYNQRSIEKNFCRRSLLDGVSFFDGLLLSMMLFVISSYVIFSLEVLMAER